MTKINFRSCLPYAIALIIFILIAYIYASPVLEGKIINQADISSYQGAAKERDDYKKQTGEESFWTNSMFSGMPTTMIGAHYKGNYLETIYNHLFWGPRPASYLILTFVSFFLLLLQMTELLICPQQLPVYLFMIFCPDFFFPLFPFLQGEIGGGLLSTSL